MNIQEAVKESIKLNKPMVREIAGFELEPTYKVSTENNCFDIFVYGQKISGNWNPTDEDLLSDDWKIKK